MNFVANMLPDLKLKIRNQLLNSMLRIIIVPRVGIEPTLPKELDFESSASTNSAIEAIG
jgi:hypothetical protein